MPTYDYECETCKRTFEAEQRMSDPPLVACPLDSRRTLVERIRNFKNTVGVIRGGNAHPDRCRCQTLPDAYPDTPHQHYVDPPHSCARCLECPGYAPAVADICGGPVRRIISGSHGFVLKGSGWFRDGY